MLLSLAPIALLVLLLSASVALFGSDASYGPNQVALIIASAATMLVGWRRGMSWQAIQDGMVGAITVSIMPMMILLSVGALIGSWIISGTVPGMIYYGVQLLDPGFFYAASAVICALASLSLGSSWTVAGTLGIGLMGIATTYSLSPAITAGAVISGAYFGDKLSPLSDTTNLAAAAVGVDLFEHIKNMLWTTLPAFIAALVIFSFVGSEGAATPENITEIRDFLAHEAPELSEVQIKEETGGHQCCVTPKKVRPPTDQAVRSQSERIPPIRCASHVLPCVVERHSPMYVWQGGGPVQLYATSFSSS